MLFFESSATTHINIKKIFYSVTKKIISDIDKKIIDPKVDLLGIKVGMGELGYDFRIKKKKNCCD